MEFSPGDIVRVKTWEELKNEYGTSDDNEIYIEEDRCYYTRPMSEVFGNKQFSVKDIGKTLKGKLRIHFQEGNHGYFISPGMLDIDIFRTEEFDLTPFFV